MGCERKPQNPNSSVAYLTYLPRYHPPSTCYIDETPFCCGFGFGAWCGGDGGDDDDDEDSGSATKATHHTHLQTRNPVGYSFSLGVITTTTTSPSSSPHPPWRMRAFFR